MKPYFTVRHQGNTLRKGNQPLPFETEAEAFEKAQEVASEKGGESVVVFHDGDTSRLVRRVTKGLKVTA